MVRLLARRAHGALLRNVQCRVLEMADEFQHVHFNGLDIGMTSLWCILMLVSSTCPSLFWRSADREQVPSFEC